MNGQTGGDRVYLKNTPQEKCNAEVLVPTNCQLDILGPSKWQGCLQVAASGKLSNSLRISCLVPETLLSTNLITSASFSLAKVPSDSLVHLEFSRGGNHKPKDLPC